MEIQFEGKRALVTGAGKGIGRGVALKLADSGADVIAVSRTQTDLDSLRNENHKIKTICLDISKWDKCQDALKDIGRIDLLVNNAVVLLVKEFGTFSEEEADNLLRTNVKAIINITQMVVAGMKERGGSIVNVSSVMGTSGGDKFSVYCATKGAVDQLTRSLAVELGPHKIRVNSVNPTAVRTRMLEEIGFFDPDNALANVVNQLKDRTRLQRFAEVSDVVDPVLFLLSEHASMITGALLPIDGGLGVNYA